MERLEHDVALRAPLLIFLNLAVKPIVEALGVEEVPAGWYPRHLLAIRENVNANDALSALELVLRVEVDLFELLLKFFDVLFLQVPQLVLPVFSF